MRKILIAVVALLALGIGLWFALGRGPGSTPAAASGDADAPLAYVPADTPYVFANVERMPKETVAAFFRQSEPMVQLWQSQFDLIEAKLAQEEAAEPATKWLRALAAEFKGKSLEQAVAGVGLETQALSAIYGVGLVPVARLTLADPAAFRAFVARVETGAGEKLATGKIEQLDYWQFAAPDQPLRVVIALQGTHLVVTAAPVGDDSALRTLLGIDKPVQSLRDAAPLVALNKQYGFTPFASGYVDSARLLAEFTGPSTPLQSAFLAAMKVEKPTVDATCQSEYAALAAAAPRLVFGYTVLEPKASTGITRVELRNDIAQDLMTLRAPLPGLAAANDSAFNLGMSFKLGQVPTLANKWSAAVKASPWQCETLVKLNQTYAEAGASASNPMLFAAAPVFDGFHAIVSRFTMPTPDAPQPDVAGKLIIGSPNPASLLAMAKSFAPPLAELNLQPNGELVQLPSLKEMNAPDLPAHALMTDKLLGIAVGAGEETSLKAAMNVDPARQPLLVVGYSGEAFTQFMQSVTNTTQSIDDPAERAEIEQSMKLMRDLYALIGRIEMQLEFDEHGIAMTQSATMK
jgi:hypothetical protein